MKIIDLIVDVKKERVVKGTIPYLEIGNIDVHTKSYKLTNKASVSGAVYSYYGDILVSTVRPTRGAVTIVTEDNLAVSGAFAILRANKHKVLPKYLFYAINNSDFFDYLGRHSSGSTYPTCAKDDVYNYEIKYYDLETQQKIVDILDHIQDMLKLRRKSLNDASLLIKSRYNELISNIKPNKTLKDIVILDPELPIFEKERIRLINLDMIKSNTGEIITKKYITDDEIKASVTKYKSGDVLYSKLRPYLNKVIIAPEDGIGTAELIRVPVDKSVANNYFIREALLDDEFLNYMNSKTSGAKMPRANIAAFWNYEIKLPHINMQNDYGAFVKNVEIMKEHIINDISDLQMLFEKNIQNYLK